LRCYATGLVAVKNCAACKRFLLAVIALAENLKETCRMKVWLRIIANFGVGLIMSAFSFGQDYNQHNLVSSVSGVAPVTDSTFINTWGLARASGGPWWIAENGTGTVALYNGAGVEQTLSVTIPPADPTNKETPIGSPTATISNDSPTDFLLAVGKPAKFLFATVDGTIAGWNPLVGLGPGVAPPSTHGVTVVKTADGSAFTGLTRAFVKGKPYLYLANFSKGRIDVYDNAFNRVHLSPNRSDAGAVNGNGLFSENSFVDHELPAFFVPFGVHTIGNDVVVTYVLHEPSSPLETDGPGLGFVDIYNSEGHLLQRLEHGDWLNAPWGVTLAPLDFGRFSHDLLIGQFAGAGDTQSSGFVAAYDLASGKLDGLLQDASGKPLVINGIWSLSSSNFSPDNRNAAKDPAGQVFFTAGPNHQTQGLFGFLTAVPAELTEGNDQ